VDRRRVEWLVLLGLLVPVTAGAAMWAEPEVAAVRKVVEAQLGDATPSWL
jgi:hypothetical protein